MPNLLFRLYWDADVFLSYFEGIPERLPTLDALLVGAGGHRRQHEIVTSTVSITEAAYVEHERQQKRLDPMVEAALDAFWAQRDLIHRIEYHELIAVEARRLIRECVARGWSLRSHDAIHLASAVSLDVAEFHTYDKRLLSLNGQGIVAFTIREPATRQPALSQL